MIVLPPRPPEDTQYTRASQSLPRRGHEDPVQSPPPSTGSQTLPTHTLSLSPTHRSAPVVWSMKKHSSRSTLSFSLMEVSICVEKCPPSILSSGQPSLSQPLCSLSLGSKENSWQDFFFLLQNIKLSDKQIWTHSRGRTDIAVTESPITALESRHHDPGRNN